MKRNQVERLNVGDLLTRDDGQMLVVAMVVRKPIDKSVVFVGVHAVQGVVCRRAYIEYEDVELVDVDSATHYEDWVKVGKAKVTEVWRGAQ